MGLNCFKYQKWLAFEKDCSKLWKVNDQHWFFSKMTDDFTSLCPTCCPYGLVEGNTKKPEALWFHGIHGKSMVNPVKMCHSNRQWGVFLATAESSLASQSAVSSTTLSGTQTRICGPLAPFTQIQAVRWQKWVNPWIKCVWFLMIYPEKMEISMEICWFNLELRTMVRVCNGWETWLKMGMPRLIGNFMKKHGFDETQRISHDLRSSEKAMIFSIRKNRRVRNFDPNIPWLSCGRMVFAKTLGTRPFEAACHGVQGVDAQGPTSLCWSPRVSLLRKFIRFIRFIIEAPEIPSNPFQSPQVFPTGPSQQGALRPSRAGVRHQHGCALVFRLSSCSWRRAQFSRIHPKKCGSSWENLGIVRIAWYTYIIHI